MILLANNQPYDDRANLMAQIEDMKASLISEFLYAVNSDLHKESLQRPVSEIATSMRLIGGSSEMRRPLNVGLMFFNERPDSFFPYARIEVVDKPDATGIGMTEKMFIGPLDRQLRDALSYIKNYIIKEKVIKVSGQAEAERIYNYPYAAVEETLSNAVYHKSYQIGEPITVVVTPEGMEITSLPGPDRTISDEDIRNRKMISKRYRNRRIGDFLKELKLVEGRNTGIPTILGALLGYVLGEIGPLGLTLSLGFASCAMLYVVFGEILPQSFLMYHSKLPAFSAIAGILVGLLIIF